MKLTRNQTWTPENVVKLNQQSVLGYRFHPVCPSVHISHSHLFLNWWPNTDETLHSCSITPWKMCIKGDNPGLINIKWHNLWEMTFLVGFFIWLVVLVIIMFSLVVALEPTVFVHRLSADVVSTCIIIYYHGCTFQPKRLPPILLLPIRFPMIFLPSFPVRLWMI